MRLIDVTLPTIDENLALDEAILVESKEDVLRFWEPSSYAVVLGRSSAVDQEVNSLAVQDLGATLHRRVSGGASIVTGPGCLMYALVLNHEDHPELSGVDRIHASVLNRFVGALKECEKSVARAGTSDIAYSLGSGDARTKFSGNSLRLTKSRVLYHGTLLYDFVLGRIESLLQMPPRQPSYRATRPHREFVGNLPCGANRMKGMLATAWSANGAFDHSPFLDKVRALVESKYSMTDWILSR